MKFSVVSTHAGWIVQNMDTYTVVGGPYLNKKRAEAVYSSLTLPKFLADKLEIGPLEKAELLKKHCK